MLWVSIAVNALLARLHLFCLCLSLPSWQCSLGVSPFLCGWWLGAVVFCLCLSVSLLRALFPSHVRCAVSCVFCCVSVMFADLWFSFPRRFFSFVVVWFVRLHLCSWLLCSSYVDASRVYVAHVAEQNGPETQRSFSGVV